MDCIRDIYENVSYIAGAAVKEHEFLSYLDMALSDLRAMAPDKVYSQDQNTEDDVYITTKKETIDKTAAGCDVIFYPAIVYDICFYITRDITYRTLFEAKVSEAKKTKEKNERTNSIIMPKNRRW